MVTGLFPDATGNGKVKGDKNHTSDDKDSDTGSQERKSDSFGNLCEGRQGRNARL